MNEKLKLLGLIFLGDNFSLGNSIIKMIRNKDLGLSMSISSLINYLEIKNKFRKINE